MDYWNIGLLLAKLQNNELLAKQQKVNVSEEAFVPQEQLKPSSPTENLIRSIQFKELSPQELKMNCLENIDRAAYIKEVLNLPKTLPELFFYLKNPENAKNQHEMLLKSQLTENKPQKNVSLSNTLMNLPDTVVKDPVMQQLIQQIIKEEVPNQNVEHEQNNENNPNNNDNNNSNNNSKDQNLNSSENSNIKNNNSEISFKNTIQDSAAKQNAALQNSVNQTINNQNSNVINNNVLQNVSNQDKPNVVKENSQNIQLENQPSQQNNTQQNVINSSLQQQPQNVPQQDVIVQQQPQTQIQPQNQQVQPQQVQQPQSQSVQQPQVQQVQTEQPVQQQIQPNQVQPQNNQIQQQQNVPQQDVIVQQQPQTQIQPQNQQVQPQQPQVLQQNQPVQQQVQETQPQQVQTEQPIQVQPQQNQGQVQNNTVPQQQNVPQQEVAIQPQPAQPQAQQQTQPVKQQVPQVQPQQVQPQQNPVQPQNNTIPQQQNVPQQEVAIQPQPAQPQTQPVQQQVPQVQPQQVQPQQNPVQPQNNTIPQQQNVPQQEVAIQPQPAQPQAQQQTQPVKQQVPQVQPQQVQPQQNPVQPQNNTIPQQAPQALPPQLPNAQPHMLPQNPPVHPQLQPAPSQGPVVKPQIPQINVVNQNEILMPQKNIMPKEINAQQVSQNSVLPQNVQRHVHLPPPINNIPISNNQMSLNQLNLLPPNYQQMMQNAVQQPIMQNEIVIPKSSAHEIGTVSGMAAPITDSTMKDIQQFILNNMANMNAQAITAVNAPNSIENKDAMELFLSGLINIHDVGNLLKSSGKQAASALVLAMAAASKKGIDTSQIQDTLQFINASVATLGQDSPAQTLKSLMMLYLPWLPLNQGVGFDLEIESSQGDNNNTLSVLTVMIQTLNYGNLKGLFSLTTTNSVNIHIICSDKFPKDELLEKLNNETKIYSMQSNIEFEAQKPLKEEENENREAKVNLSATDELNPYLLLMAHSFIRNTILLDNLANLTPEKIG